MNSQGSKNAVAAILAENEKVIRELQEIIKNISPEKLVNTADSETTNPDCRSIQTVLTHVVGSGYSYCVYIRNHRGGEDKRPERKIFEDVQHYLVALDEVNEYTHETFGNIYDHELEEFGQSKKILTRWGQLYDIEQLMEHAIVHISRHRRQIEGFKKITAKL